MIQQQPFNPTDRLTVTLEAQQWNQVLALLGEGSYRLVEPIIQKMHDQLYAQHPNASADEPDNVVHMEAKP